MGNDHIFSIKSEMAYREGWNSVDPSGLRVKSCGLGFRPREDDIDKNKKP